MLFSKRKRKRSDSVLWQKPLHPQNKPKREARQRFRSVKESSTKQSQNSNETDGLGDKRKFIRTTRRFITCLYCIQFEKNWHVPHLKCVKNKFHNKRNDTETRYKSKSHAICVFCGSSPRRRQENLFKTQRYKLLFKALYTYLRLEIYRNTFGIIEFAKAKVFIILNYIFNGSHF